ncbi:hypothetical protein D1B31_13450 [Neobacillus notoginsengisoli]|uniref:Uncharacterized protein n=1 Tax=Neobacillus notoginsengisoli TaxID=1578198 RepID=A0A417YSN6_9BACI|nr:YheC/YheD family protein [Neobacillus notoginsengisoli]RHW38970.1 hypothetical protein D1B31_13450 [Neobacillus notoginsengisoli]
MIDHNLFHLVHLLYVNNEKKLKLTLEEEMLFAKLLEMENLPEQFKGQLNHFLPNLEENKLLLKRLEAFYGHYKQLQKVTYGMIYHSKRHAGILPALIEEVVALTLVERVAVVIFPISEMDLENNIIKGILIENGEVQTEALTHIPGTIYNLAVHTKPASVRKIRALQKSATIQIVNPVNRFRQLHLLEMVSSLPGADKFLPAFHLFNKQNLQEFAAKSRLLYLLPDRPAGDTQLITAEKLRENEWVISEENRKMLSDGENLFDDLQKKIGTRTGYLIDGQDCLHFENEPATVRVYVQKNDRQHWDIVNMIAKTSGSFAFYNTASHFDRATGNENKEVSLKVTDCALTCITYLGHFVPNLGTAFLDFYINQDGSPYLYFVGGAEQNGTLILPLSKSERGQSYLANLLLYMSGLIEREAVSHVD